MKIISTFFLLLLLFSSKTYAQLDNPSGGRISLEGFNVAGESIDAEFKEGVNFSASKNPSLSNLQNGFIPVPKERSFSDEEPKTFSMKTKTAGLSRYYTDFEPRYLKQDREIRESHRRDQNLGSISTTSKMMTVMYRDHEYVDGDRVRIYINGVMQQANVVLGGNWKGFNYNLDEDLNQLQFEALNMGTSGPNTASFKIVGESGEILNMNEWNLATGNTATLVIVKK